MSEIKKEQMKFDFFGGSAAGGDLFSATDPAGREESGGSEISEEEEMAAFVRELHAGKSAAGEPAADECAGPDGGNGAAEFTESFRSAAPAKPPAKLPLTKAQLRRAALAFMASLNPAGLALNVPTRKGRFRTDVAAFWTGPGRKGAMTVIRTALAEVRTEAQINIECVSHADELRLLNESKRERDFLQAEIRKTEPELRDDSTLFAEPELEHWNYAASKNSAYQECLKKIAQQEYAIYHGSRLDRFRTAQAVSELYLVAPEGALETRIIEDGWGLVYVDGDLAFRLARAARVREVPEDRRIQLAWNIAAAAKPAVLFAHGIRTGADTTPEAGPPPRQRRRKTESS